MMTFQILLACLAVSNSSSYEFNQPFRIKADGAYIDVGEGHAAPAYVDFDGDGVKDLLVGQFEGGQLRVYKNHQSDTQPVFKDYRWFQAGGEIARIPSG